ncbi:hypothetical protein BCR44DRAFT_1016727 [Catenaria anguillulae PL171]|uniref:Uncharacterized protein n=1 Tax=Catenaria anguillulae PL171 TaxID=765915 RepID=A0A1Y2HUD0_9FUNG|nr:hypothetical protein BCR44DRAFT_1016727 [Catenaria anguillulae PL171]
MSTRDLGTMEFEFLSLLQWDLSVSTVQFAAWLSTLTTAAALVFSPTLSPSANTCRTPLPAIGGGDSLDKLTTTSEFVLPGAFNTSPLVPASDLPPIVASTPTSIVATASKRSRTTSSKSMRLRKASSVVMQVLAASQSHLFQAAHETATVLAAHYPTPAVATVPMELTYPYHSHHHLIQQQLQLQQGTPMASSPFPTVFTARARRLSRKLATILTTCRRPCLWPRLQVTGGRGCTLPGNRSTSAFLRSSSPLPLSTSVPTKRSSSSSNRMRTLPRRRRRPRRAGWLVSSSTELICLCTLPTWLLFVFLPYCDIPFVVVFVCVGWSVPLYLTQSVALLLSLPCFCFACSYSHHSSFPHSYLLQKQYSPSFAISPS